MPRESCLIRRSLNQVWTQLQWFVLSRRMPAKIHASNLARVTSRENEIYRDSVISGTIKLERDIWNETRCLSRRNETGTNKQKFCQRTTCALRVVALRSWARATIAQVCPPYSMPYFFRSESEGLNLRVLPPS